MPADMTIQIYDDSRNRYRFRVVASNGNCLARSAKSFSERDDLMAAINETFNETTDIEVYPTVTKAGGKPKRPDFRWRALRSGSVVLMASEGYADKQYCLDMATKIMSSRIVDEP